MGTTDQHLEMQVQKLTQRANAAEEVIRQMEDDAIPPAALPAWERYRAQYPRENP